MVDLCEIQAVYYMVAATGITVAAASVTVTAMRAHASLAPVSELSRKDVEPAHVIKNMRSKTR